MELDFVDFGSVSSYYTAPVLDKCPCDDVILDKCPCDDVILLASAFANLNFVANTLGTTFERADDKELSLTAQFERGILQHRIAAKELDPQDLINKAILEQSPEVVRFLLDQGIDVNQPDEDGVTPLAMAFKTNCDFAVRLLIERGARPFSGIKV